MTRRQRGFTRFTRPEFVAAPLRDPLDDQRPQLRDVADPVGVGRQPRVVGEFRDAEDVGELAELPVVARSDEDWLSTCWPPDAAKSTQMFRLVLLIHVWLALIVSLVNGGPQVRVSSLAGGSILITSAPWSASIWQHSGPTRMRDMSTTRMPWRLPFGAVMADRRFDRRLRKWFRAGVRRRGPRRFRTKVAGQFFPITQLCALRKIPVPWSSWALRIASGQGCGSARSRRPA